MISMLTLADLLASGGPLARATLLAGSSRVTNGISWAVSLRPYAPAIPPLKGGEIALVGAEVLARHEPPVTMADVVRQLAARGASGLAVRGEPNDEAVQAAEEAGLPLVFLPDNVLLHEIEQEIMRECALFQARREVMATEEAGGWIRRLLAGQIATLVEAQGPARREGYTLGTGYAVALVAPVEENEEAQQHLQSFAAALPEPSRKREPGIIHHPFEEGVALLVPPGGEGKLRSALRGHGVACGVGKERPLLDAPTSLEEARLALISSKMLHAGKLVRYADLGAERMLLLLYLHDREELEHFVEEALDPLLRHDARSATPLLPTVSSFVKHSGRLRETAAEIFVHRNTLAYRLDRAADILGVDLRDADARLAVEMALRALPFFVAKREDDRPPTKISNKQ
jgi:hypothetical protein